MSRLRLTIKDRVFLVACGKEPPTDAEWAAYVMLVKDQGVGMSQIIATEGGEPTPRQRQALDDALDGLALPTAVLSSNRCVRFRVWLLSVFDRTIAGFPDTGMRKALEFLEMPVSRAPLYQRELDKLREGIDDDPPELPPAHSAPGLVGLLVLVLAIVLGGGGMFALVDAAERASTHGRP